MCTLTTGNRILLGDDQRLHLSKTVLLLGYCAYESRTLCIATNKKAVMKYFMTAWLYSDPGQVRTVDPLIKSQLLYQLSYGVIVV